MSTTPTQFDYLLNAFERASQAVTPADHGYAEKRRALFAYVRGLEAPCTAPEEGALHELQRVLREPCDPNDRRRARAVVRDLLAALTAPTEPTHAERGHDDGVPRTF